MMKNRLLHVEADLAEKIALISGLGRFIN